MEETLAERSRFVERLSTLPLVRRVYPSEANFVLVRVEDATALYNWLVEVGIVVRNRSSVTLCDDCLRITIGQADEMDSLWEALCRYNQNREK